jgi:hypothetical protein
VRARRRLLQQINELQAILDYGKESIYWAKYPKIRENRELVQQEMVDVHNRLSLL